MEGAKAGQARPQKINQSHSNHHAYRVPAHIRHLKSPAINEYLMDLIKDTIGRPGRSRGSKGQSHHPADHREKKPQHSKLTGVRRVPDRLIKGDRRLHLLLRTHLIIAFHKPAGQHPVKRRAFLQ